MNKLLEKKAIKLVETNFDCQLFQDIHERLMKLGL